MRISIQIEMRKLQTEVSRLFHQLLIKQNLSQLQNDITADERKAHY